MKRSSKSISGNIEPKPADRIEFGLLGLLRVSADGKLAVCAATLIVVLLAISFVR